jgi:hypothetical protein
MAKTILLKQDAIRIYNNSKNTDMGLYAEDLNTSGAKTFHAQLPDYIYKKIVDPTVAQSHLYESWSDKTKLLFALDLDIKGLSNVESLNVAKNNIIKICKAMKQYHGHEYDINDIIVLESEPTISIKESNKYSYHVIFRGIVFQNHEVCKDFYIQANKDFDIEHGDVSIYGLTCLRLCYCCKKGKDAILLPKEIVIGDKKTLTDMNSEMDEYEFFLRTLMTFKVDTDDILISKSQMFKKPKPEPKEALEIPKNSMENINIEEVLFQLPHDACDDYDTWRLVGTALYHCDENHDKYFDLWNRWSAQSEKYVAWDMKKRWANFSRSTGNIGYIINLCKRNGVTNLYKNSKLTFTDIVKAYPKREIELFTNERTLIVNKPKLDTSIFSPYINKKLLCLQSEKGTGKTSNLLKTLFEEKKVIGEKTSMLFISSRRTFGAKLLGDLKQYGFVLYSDIKESDIHNKKVICQIDSLGRVAVDKFDWIIVDECESCARYITAKHFIKNPKANIIVSAMEQRIYEAKQVVIMDADLSNRCMEYYQNVMDTKEHECQLIINTFKAFSEYTMVTMGYNDWVQRIIEDVGKGLKLAIPMASNNKAKDLKTMINTEFPDLNVLLIHKETKDEDKVKSLLNVNDSWREFDVVIYTPSVCMGVSFDVPNYFDSIYGYGCENSLGSQEFCQMLHRIREPTNKVINIALNLYREFDDIEDILTFKQVEEILCSDYYLTRYDLHQNIIQVKMGRAEPDENGNSARILFYPYKTDPNYRLFVHNALENILNTQNFGASFFGYVKEKEYKIDFFSYSSSDKNAEIKNSMKEISKERVTGETEISVQGILDAPDINKEDFVELLKQRDEFLTFEDVQKINRYKFRNCYSLLTDDVELTFDLVEELNTRDKLKWYHNLSNIMATKDQSTESKLEMLKDNVIKDKYLTTCYMDFTSKNTYAYQLFATNIVNNTGFDINNTDTVLPYNMLCDNVANCISYIDSNKEEIAYKFGLRIYNKKFENLPFKEQLTMCNSILSGFYGLKIKKISGVNKDIDNTYYKLSDSKIWDCLPREEKIIPIDIKSNIHGDQNDPNGILRTVEYLLNDEDDEDDEEF